MATIRKTQTTNQVLFDTIRDLRKLSNSTGAGVYKAVAIKLASTASQRPEVNLDRSEKHSIDKEVVIVPGKVVGNGTLTKKVTIVGFKASESAIAKIEKAGATFIEIRDYISKKHDVKMKILG
jgi:large subunit ribosomal protein L18e